MKTIYIIVRKESYFTTSHYPDTISENVQAYFDKNIADDFANHMTNTCVDKNIEYVVEELTLFTQYKTLPQSVTF